MEIKEVIYETVDATHVKMKCPYCRTEVVLEDRKLSGARCGCGKWAVTLEARFDYVKRYRI